MAAILLRTLWPQTQDKLDGTRDILPLFIRGGVVKVKFKPKFHGNDLVNSSSLFLNSLCGLRSVAIRLYQVTPSQTRQGNVLVFGTNWPSENNKVGFRLFQVRQKSRCSRIRWSLVARQFVKRGPGSSETKRRGHTIPVGLLWSVRARTRD